MAFPFFPQGSQAKQFLHHKYMRQHLCVNKPQGYSQILLHFSPVQNPSSTTPPTTGWGVQVGAYASFDSATQQATQLQAYFKQPTFIKPQTLSGQTMYKLLIGHFTDPRQAVALQGQLQNAGINGFAKNFADL